jgi:ferric-dicitrate binding protein FerR (iron transport regulator)
MVAAFGLTIGFRRNAARDVTSVAAAPTYTIATKPGQRLDLRMPDGTRVVLGVASTLRYPKDYGVSQRQFYLEGQAYFEVAHDDVKPLTVYAGNAAARDLGTRFEVRAYAGDDGVEVVVAEGKVELTEKSGTAAASASRAVLVSGQLGRVNGTGRIVTRTRIDMGQRLGWIDGRLEFTDVPLRDMLPQLSRWYDVEFRLADPALGHRRLTGTFQGESVSALLQFLALSLDAGYEWDGRTIVLTSNYRVP